MLGEPDRRGTQVCEAVRRRRDRAVASAAGLVRVGINLQRLPPGTRSSWPHAESDEEEEEFVDVMDGEVDDWIDGELHRMLAGDLAAFLAGTGSVTAHQQHRYRRCSWSEVKPRSPAIGLSTRVDLKAADSFATTEGTAKEGELSSSRLRSPLADLTRARRLSPMRR